MNGIQLPKISYTNLGFSSSVGIFDPLLRFLQHSKMHRVKLNYTFLVRVRVFKLYR
jgi:hypothetical protein